MAKKDKTPAKTIAEELMETEMEIAGITEIEVEDEVELEVKETFSQSFEPREDIKEVDTYLSHLPFAERIKKQKEVKHTFSEIYAPIFGSYYDFLLNGVRFVIRFDGKPTVLPIEIFDYFNVKLADMVKASKPREVITETTE